MRMRKKSVEEEKENSSIYVYHTYITGFLCMACIEVVQKKIIAFQQYTYHTLKMPCLCMTCKEII